MEGPSFYDDDEVFETYLKRRQRGDNPNDTLEKPVLLELIGDVRDQTVLDLGCGDAGIARELFERGALAYLGLDGSEKMCSLARQALRGTAGQVVHADLQQWDYPPEAFDLVISRLALHYVSDLEAVLRLVYRTLRPGGKMVFSVEHPVITSTDRGWKTGVRQDWVVDDYFETGVRTTEWMGGEVVKYHRTIEDCFSSVRAAGFMVEHLREARPQRDQFIEAETYQRRKRIPLFLLIAASKAS